MGTTSEHFFLRNDGRSPEEWLDAMKKAAIFQPRKYHLLGEVVPAPVLFYKSGAPWLPVFDESLGYYMSEPSMMPLSQDFGIPSLSFAQMDSDILFVTYCDAAQGLQKDYLRGISPAAEEAYGYEEGDGYLRTLPEFMLEFGEWAKLRKAWEEKVVFAGDRMHSLCKIMGIVPVYDRDDLPEGYRPLCLREGKQKKSPDNIVYFNEFFGKGE